MDGEESGRIPKYCLYGMELAIPYVREFANRALSILAKPPWEAINPKAPTKAILEANDKDIKKILKTALEPPKSLNELREISPTK